MDIDTLLDRYGPMTTSRAAEMLTRRGITPDAARQRVSRRGAGVETLRGLTFPKRARFIYLSKQFGTDQYWHALISEIREANPAYAAALAAIQARGGITLRKHFDIISGSPVRQKRQLASEVVLKNLESASLVETHEIDGIGPCVVLGPSAEGLALRAKRLRALLVTEGVLLDAIRSWSGRMNLASPKVTRIRDDQIAPQFTTFKFDLTGPSYVQPLVTYTGSKLNPGFFVADVLLGAELDEPMVAAFLRKCAMLANFRKCRPFLPMLIADSFTMEALKACRAKGIITTRPETLFGRDVARGLEDLLHTLTNTATGSPERIEKLFAKLSAIEGAAGNLRGALFELIVSHCVRELEGGQIALGSVLMDSRNGKRAEVDVLWEKQRQLAAYECKGYRSPVNLLEVEKWLNQKVPTIYAALKQQDRYSSSRFAFEFWTASTFDSDAEAFLRESRQKIRRYQVGWKCGAEIRAYAKGLTSPSLRRILDDHYFREPLSSEPVTA